MTHTRPSELTYLSFVGACPRRRQHVISTLTDGQTFACFFTLSHLQLWRANSGSLTHALEGRAHRKRGRRRLHWHVNEKARKNHRRETSKQKERASAQTHGRGAATPLLYGHRHLCGRQCVGVAVSHCVEFERLQLFINAVNSCAGRIINYAQEGEHTPKL